jgi:dimethylhistidine N-methyltransferase
MIAREPLLVPAIAADVAHGLGASPKSLPPWLFYDAHGSELFEKITVLPEYYPTRTETQILKEHAEEICRSAGGNVTVMELGAGTATKTRILLGQLLRRQLRVIYVPVDVSRAALESAHATIARELPEVMVRPVVADYTVESLNVTDLPGRKLLLYLGSSIGNFEREAAVALLRRARGGLSSGDSLLLGADRVKPASILIPAYDDARGITAEFNKNVLGRINRELGGHFDLGAFRHIAEWNQGASRIEIYLESAREQSVKIDLLGMTVHFKRGERIHTENSYKYSDDAILRLLADAGYTLEQTFSDECGWFGLHLARVG